MSPSYKKVALACCAIFIAAFAVWFFVTDTVVVIEKSQSVQLFPRKSINHVEPQSSKGLDLSSNLNDRGQTSSMATKSSIAGLPRVNAPLMEILPSLKTQADSGNRAASCRLGFELDRCGAHLRMVAEVRRNAISDRGQKPSEKIPAFLANNDALRRKFERDSLVCEGVNEAETLEAWRRLANAAFAGDGPSMIRFASGSGMRLQTLPLENIEGWATYKANAVPFLENAFELGYPAAGLHLSQIYIMPRFGAQLVPVDPVKSISYLLALSRVGNAALQEGNSRDIKYISEKFHLTEADLARAESTAIMLSTKIKRVPEGGLDFTKGTDPMNDGADCQY